MAGPKKDVAVHGKTLTRYMSLTKFLNLLARKSIFVPVASRFVDYEEGVDFSENMTQVLARFERALNGGDVSETSPVKNRESQLILQQHVPVSCWTMKRKECFLMWTAYCSGAEGIAMEVDATELLRNFESHAMDVYHRKVIYKIRARDLIEDIEEVPSIISPYFKKEPYYSSEEEYRFVLDPSSAGTNFSELYDDGGTNCKIKSLNDLILRVLIHPRAGKEFTELVSEQAIAAGIMPEKIKRSSVQLR